MAASWPSHFALGRARERVRPSTPVALAKRIIAGFEVVPVTALISDVLDDAICRPDRRYVLSTPPRVGKSQLASVVAPLFALMRDADGSVLVKGYGDQLAEEHSGQARRLVADNKRLLGFEVDQSKSAVDRWLVAGYRGGVLAGGIASPATGFGVSSLMVIDDPIKGAAEAGSPAHRRRLLSAFRSDLLTRLHPGASCVVISTRWHTEDLPGSLLDEGGEQWRHINVPAVTTAGVRDDLCREPGRPVSNPLGYSVSDFARIRMAAQGRSRVGDAVSRSQGMIAALENGRCSVAGYLPKLEADMLAWEGHQHQPDRVAAAMIAFDTLESVRSAGMTIAAPLSVVGSGGQRSAASLSSSSRPGIDTMVAAATARKRALAAGTDPASDPAVRRAAAAAARTHRFGRRL